MAGAKRKKRRSAASRAVGGGVLAVLLTAAALPAAVATPAHGSRGPALGTTQLISFAADGGPADGASHSPVISADGDVAAFLSEATNLVPGDTNGKADIFVRDLRHGTVQRVETPPGNVIHEPALSADGRYLAYAQYGDEDNVFVRDLRTGHTERAGVELDAGHTGGESPSLSADGRTVAFLTRNEHPHSGPSAVYVRDLRARRTERVSFADTPGSKFSAVGWPSLSGDGTKVAYQYERFDTSANYDWGDVYVYDRLTGAWTQVDTTHDGSPANRPAYNPALSFDGSAAVFDSAASNLLPGEDPEGPDPFVRDLRTGKLTRVDGLPPGPSTRGISADGSKLLLYASPVRNVYAAYIRDLRTGVTVMVSPNMDGKPAIARQAKMDARARRVIFAGDDSFVPGDTNRRQDILVRTVP
ncbi:TolB family protein [Streptomyces sp. G45]|uniref:TolB family protein n=1 Tax=Streptomyces sp. G45 TaxID=3406627 RepID=UPI003C135774